MTKEEKNIRKKLYSLLVDNRHRLITERQFVDKAMHQINLSLGDIGGSLPCKDLVVAKGYDIAKNATYNYRKVLRDQDHDIYYSGWMDCYDWLIDNDR